MQDINLCSIDGCGRQARSLGWCARHYTRNRRYGSPTGKPRRATLRERIEAKILKGDGCWTWTGAHNAKGYSVLRVDSRTPASRNLLVHREIFSWTHEGPLPPGMELDHICHNRGCVHPEHLRLTTRKQNAENYSGLSRNNTSGYRGVWKRKADGLWMASVGHNGKHYKDGPHATPEGAAEAARRMRLRLHTHNDADRDDG